MSQQVVETFVQALEALESQRDLEKITAIFSESAEVGNVLVPAKFHGPGGARDFWKHYRDTFGDMKSVFRNRIVTDHHAALEWTTEGTAKNGEHLRYDGVSILETDGSRITRFQAYFDSHLLGRQMEEKD